MRHPTEHLKEIEMKVVTRPGATAERHAPPQPVVLPPECLEHVAGGLNPQPLPPRHEEFR